MRSGSAIAVGLLQLALCCAGFSESVPKLKQILPRIQEHVRVFEHSLPDFICDETIISRELMRGRVHQKTVIASAFRGTQHKEEDRAFTESRKIQTIDGKPAPPDQPLKGPFFFGGGFSSVLDEIFSKENAQYFHYKVKGKQQLEGKTTWVIKMETKKNQKEILYRDVFGSKTAVKGSGKAWIDPETMNVMRIEFEYQNPPLEGELKVSVDYAPAVINGQTFWMPKTVTAKQAVPNSTMSIAEQYIASYSNYHQFNVSHKIYSPIN
ncbi:MAG TPA: hypothetical protein VFB76_19225 [Candidatus Angelobacter sp.]|nr:hypothetical protein [Candidatus Angelobacter sp.]